MTPFGRGTFAFLTGLKFTLAFGVALAAGTPASPSSPTQQLLLHTLNRYAPMDPAITADLLKRGASLKARNRSDATAFVLAVETYSYQTNDPQGQPLAAQTKETIRALIQAGANINDQDGRGATALVYLLTYAKFPEANEVMDLILERQPNFNVAGHDDGVRLIHFIMSATAANESAALRLLKDHNQKMELTAKTFAGRNPLHYAATGRKLPSGNSTLRELLRLLPKETLQKLMREKDESGNTPFLLAALSGNVDNLKALAEVGAPINDVNVEGDGALDLAERLGFKESANYLKAQGALIYQRPSQPIVCGLELPSPLSWNNLSRYLDQCSKETNSVEKLMAVLPKTTRSNYVLVFAGRGLQVGSKTFPRMLFFGPDAGVILSINGHRRHNGYLSVETMNLDPATRRLELREIDFSKPKVGAIVSRKNPEKCIGCHGEDPRPIWSNWTLWPGIYFGEMLNLYPTEKAWFQKFKKATRSNPRYQLLLPSTLHPSFGNGVWEVGVNNIPRITMDFSPRKLDVLVDSINQTRFEAALRAEVADRPQRWALLAALSCKDSIRDYFPPEDPTNSPERLSEIDSDMKRRARAADQEMNEFIFKSTEGKGLVGRYQLESYLFGENYFKNSPRIGLNFAHDTVVRARFVLDPLFGPEYLQRWSFDFTRTPSLSFSIFAPLEYAAWKALVSPTDQELYRLVQPDLDRAAKTARVVSFLSDKDQKDIAPICQLLKTRSLQALKVGGDVPPQR